MKYVIISVCLLSILMIIGAFLIKTLNITPGVKIPSPFSKAVLDRPLISKPPPKFPPDQTAGCIPGKIATLDELIKESETIVIGKVDKITAQKELGGSIYSTITLTPVESFKKAQTTALSIRVRGGEINGIGEVWGCAAKFRENEQVIVFLKKDLKKQSVFIVVSGLEGKFTIHQNEVSRGIPKENTQKLEDFKNNIKKLTGNQSFKVPFSYFSFVKDLPNRFFDLFIHQAFAWKPPILTSGGFGVRWYPEQYPIKYYMHNEANSKVGDVTWEAARRALGWWDNSGANFTLADGGLYPSFFYIFCLCWQDSRIGDGKNQIVFQNSTDLLDNPDNIAETVYRHTCFVSPKIRTLDYAFCKLTEADTTINDSALWPQAGDIDPVAYFTQLVGHELGHSLGLDHSLIIPTVMDGTTNSGLLTGLQEDDIDGITSIYPENTDLNLAISSTDSGNVTVTLDSGTTQQVDLSVENDSDLLTNGITTTWPNGSSVNPTDSRQLTISASATTPVNTSGYPITIKGVSANTPDKFTNFKLFVYPANTPAAPTISNTPACVSGSSYTATLNWTGTSYATGSCGDGFWVDIDNDSDWDNGYYHKCVSDPARSTSAPSGFGAYAGASGTLTLQPDQIYYARVYNGVQSAVSNIGSIPACVFDYSLSNSGGITITQGLSGSNIITKTLISGTTQGVTLSASGLPPGASPTFTSNPCNPTCSSTLTISTLSSTTPDSYIITVTGSPLGKKTTFTLTVKSISAPSGAWIQTINGDVHSNIGIIVGP